MNKTLLMIGAGVEQVPAINIAKKMGLFVVTTDGNLKAPGFKYSDDFLVVSTYDFKKTADLATEYSANVRKIDGVIAVASDVPKTVAYCAKKMGVFGYPMKTAKIASDKVLMKNIFSKNNIPVPEYKEVNNITDLKTFLQKVGFPIVLKPVDSRGARGVLRIENQKQLEWGLNYSRSFSSSKRVIVEKFIHGPQISSESVIYEDKVFTPVLSDRNYEYLKKFSPYIIENGGTLPSTIDNSVKEKIDETILKCARSMGIYRGTIKGDIVISGKTPIIIEVATRLSGGYFCTDQIPLSCGVNIVETAIKIVLNEPIKLSSLQSKFSKGVTQRFFFANPGKIIQVKGLKKVKKMKKVKKLIVYVKKGDKIEKVTDHTKRLGFLITQGKNRKEAIAAANKALKEIKIVTRYND